MFLILHGTHINLKGTLGNLEISDLERNIKEGEMVWWSLDL